MGIAALGVVIILSVGAFSYYKWIASHKVALDPHTNCPVTGPVSVTAVLLDSSDPISQATLDDLRNNFNKMAFGTPQGGLISIYALTERAGQLRPLFAACNPGDGSDTDPITSNPRLAKQRWEDGYRKPFGEFEKGLDKSETAARSPIMAAIQQIELTFFDRYESTLEKNLVIASDMIEYTDAYSQYKSGASYAAFQRSLAKDMYRTSLSGVAVTVLYIQRRNAPAKPTEHCEFWARWFLENKAADAKFIRLEGFD
jgi:hypothetical protein